jgi:hypothetical protein
MKNVFSYVIGSSKTEKRKEREGKSFPLPLSEEVNAVNWILAFNRLFAFALGYHLPSCL